MFGLRNKKPEETPESPVGPLDRIGRRSLAETRPDAATAPVQREARIAAAAAALREAVAPRLRDMVKAGASAGEITRQAGLLAQVHFRSNGVLLAPLELRGYVADVLRPVLPATSFSAPAASESVAEETAAAAAAVVGAVPAPDLSERSTQIAPAALAVALQPTARPLDPPKPEITDKSASRLSRSKVDQARRVVQPLVMRHIDLGAAVSLPRKELVHQLEGLVAELLVEHRHQLNRPEQADLVYQIVNDMMGLGPLEPLLGDETITDIMINGPRSRSCRAARQSSTLTTVTFEDNTHLLNICNRIVSRIGRRVDNRARSATPACSTAAASTSSSRRSPSTAPRCRSESSASARSASTRWRSRATSRRPWRRCCARRALPVEPDRVGRHRLGQDHDAERPVGHDRQRRSWVTIEDAAGSHAAAARRAPGDAAG
jgi:pilus assembly protein CpaF